MPDVAQEAVDAITTIGREQPLDVDQAPPLEDPRDDRALVGDDAEVPLAEMFGYATAIRSLSKGRSSYSMEPSHFEQVPQQLVAAVLDQKETK